MRIATIYEDQDCTKVIGKAKLLQLVKKGLPVILDGHYPDRHQIVYRFDKYRVEFVDDTIPNASSIYEVRKVHSIGSVHNSDENNPVKILEKDKFLKVNGKQIY